LKIRISTTKVNVGVTRNVSVKKENGESNITMAETGSEFKTVTFPAIRRWVHLTRLVEHIDDSVNQLIMKHNVDVELAMRGKW